MHRLKYQPRDVGQAVVFAEAHLRAIGLPELSPVAFVRNVTWDAGEVVAVLSPATKLRAAEVLPGLRLKSGNSILDVVKVIPTNKEVIYKNNRGGEFRMPTDKFVKLSTQQGYRKVWNVKNFLISLKALLKPVLDSVPLMWVMKWVLNMIRGKKAVPSDRSVREVSDIERGRNLNPGRDEVYDAI